MPRPSGKRRRPRATRSAADMRARDWFSKVMSPPRACSRPMMVFSVVVLPAPLWPSRIEYSPGAMAKETSEMTVFAP